MRTPCPDCGGRGYSYSDPDGKQLVCQTCGGDDTDSATFMGMDKAIELMREKIELMSGKEGKVSEKYSTDELIEALSWSRRPLTYAIETVIGNRLLSADVLCKATKKLEDLARIMIGECPIIEDVRKAIAEYEGKGG